MHKEISLAYLNTYIPIGRFSLKILRLQKSVVVDPPSPLNA